MDDLNPGTSNIPIAIQQSPEHSLAGHPENPRRYDRFTELFETPIGTQLKRVDFEAVDEDLVRSVHTPLYLESLQMVEPGQVRLIDFGDTYLTAGSYHCARLAAGAIVAVADALLDSEALCGFALARPPGHHATENEGMGFCLFNNIAIAARHLQRQGLQRLLIVDFDVHHGNGTQDIFYEDADVHFLSTHQAGIYPGTGAVSETGRSAGSGTTLNVPLPARTGNQGMQRVFDEIVGPYFQRVKPDAVLVSAGYDAHADDPLASLQLTEVGFHRIASRLLEMAERTTSGKALFVLEGGYNPEALYGSVLATLYCMTGRELEQADHERARPVEPNISDVIERVREMHDL